MAFNPNDITKLFMARLERANPLEALKGAIVGNYEEVLDINREQLDKGEDAGGIDMGEYSNFYANIKGRKSPIDLKNYGDYRDKMYLAINDEGTDIKSRDNKSERINKYVRKKSGGEPLGINAENIPKMGAMIKDELTKEYKQQLGL